MKLIRYETIREFLDKNGFNDIIIDIYEAGSENIISIKDNEPVEISCIENVKVIDIDRLGHCVLYLRSHTVTCRFNDLADIILHFLNTSAAHVLDFVHFIQRTYGFDYNNKVNLMMDDIVHAGQRNDFEWFEKLFKYKDDKWLLYVHHALYSNIWDSIYDFIPEIKCLLIKEIRERNINAEEDISL